MLKPQSLFGEGILKSKKFKSIFFETFSISVFSAVDLVENNGINLTLTMLLHFDRNNRK